MTWGPIYFYYQCPKCKKLFKYSFDLAYEFEEDFGKCPLCKIMGVYIKDGPRALDDLLYEEVE
ncbi:hypothetical protein PKF05_00035 [Fusobacterium simiae]|uniref:Excinuclease ATPase subunit n=1 Tax=Fusobacterium simiae TaxID=855 RepID=A0ABT4DPL9_FUSSI|nr:MULTISPECIES: hypothetical protein [Fusobacterium]MCY7009244.1 hypothetical protein [Fusobacterium simiae]MDC7954222.1 hypothetical protein [Fusobacterium simiae]